MLYGYISACGVDKNYLKWQEIQLAMHCGVGSLIDLELCGKLQACRFRPSGDNYYNYVLNYFRLHFLDTYSKINYLYV